MLEIENLTGDLTKDTGYLLSVIKDFNDTPLYNLQQELEFHKTFKTDINNEILIKLVKNNIESWLLSVSKYKDNIHIIDWFYGHHIYCLVDILNLFVWTDTNFINKDLVSNLYHNVISDYNPLKNKIIEGLLQDSFEMINGAKSLNEKENVIENKCKKFEKYDFLNEKDKINMKLQLMEFANKA